MADQFTGERQTGIVKWFNDNRGVGFVTPDDGDSDLFVHFRAINKPGVKSLEEGERVSFIAEWGQKGPQASQVQPEE